MKTMARCFCPAQSKRFIEAAKALGVDESGKAFEEVMRSLAKRKKGKPADGLFNPKAD